MAARQVVPKLNSLETLVGAAAQRRAEAGSTDETPTPFVPFPLTKPAHSSTNSLLTLMGFWCRFRPHKLPPQEILAAHLTPALVAHQSQLNARLQTTQSHNAALFEKVRAQRDEIDGLLDLLEAAVADVRAANEALAPVVTGVAEEARQGEADLIAAAGPATTTAARS
jgi:kinetochore protein NNF1